MKKTIIIHNDCVAMHVIAVVVVTTIGNLNPTTTDQQDSSPAVVK